MLGYIFSNISVRRIFEQLQLLTFMAVLITLPIQWFNLASFFHLTLKPVSICVAFLICLALLSSKIRKSLIDVSGFFWPFIIFYLGYLFFPILSLFLTGKETTSGFTYTVKGAVYMVFFIVTTGFIVAHGTTKIGKAVYIAVAGGCLLFLGLAVYIFSRMGRNIIMEFIKGILSMDLNVLLYGFYPGLFTYFKSAFPTIYGAVNLRHTILDAFVLFFFLLQIFKPLFLKEKEKFNFFLWLCFSFFTFFLILTSFSRSIWIGFGGGLLVAGLIVLFRGRIVLTLEMVVILITVIVLSSFLMGFNFELIRNVFELFTSHLEGIAHDNRLKVYDETLKGIEASPLVGYGVGVIISEHGTSHNLFLGSWVEGGLLGVGSALFFFGFVLFHWGVHCVQSIFRPKNWHLPIAPQWVAALPMIPMFRSQVAASGGYFGLAQWLFFAFFFAFIFMNKRVGREISHSPKMLKV